MTKTFFDSRNRTGIRLPLKLNLGLKLNLSLSLFLSLILFLLAPILSHGQYKGLQLTTSAYGLYSSGDDLPFWFTSNQQGIFEHANESFQIADVSIRKDYNWDKKWNFTYGGRFIYAEGATNYHQLNEAYAGISYQSFYIKAGAFPDETVYEGLSSTNGNFDWSNNARPMPRIRIATHDFIPLPFGKHSNFWKDVRFKGIYEESFMNDDSRYVKNTHLHHKSLYLRKQINSREHVTFGGDHYAMWGGTSPDFGELPGFKSYLRSIFFLAGSEDSPTGDQIYFSGNHLGMIYLDYEKTYRTGTFTMYVNHPWDHVPAVANNLFDNLIGLNFKMNKKSFISNILVEVINTNDQSRVMHVRQPQDPTAYFEHYFEHGEYKSGFSYENRILGSPFMSPMVIKDGINYGTGNNRISLLHVAFKGYLAPNLSWKYFISYCRSSGTYGGQAYDAMVPGYFDMTRHKFSQLGELHYEMPKAGLDLSVAVASDNGHLENVYGAMFKLKKTFSIRGNH